MFYQWYLNFKKPENTLWVAPTLGAVLAVVFVLIAKLADSHLSADAFPHLDLDTLDDLLNVIASTMLAVSTFSLSIMVSAFGSASNATTPRATKLVMSDGSTRLAIGSFLSAFVYAIIAKIALGLGFYAQNGRFVLFVGTLLILGYLILMLIRWVQILSQLGGQSNTLSKISHATQAAVQAYYQDPQMGTGGKALADTAPPVLANGAGYLTHINLAGLQKLAQDQQGYIHIIAHAGDFIMPDSTLALVENVDAADEIRACFMIDASRDFAQDPEWGFIVLSEVAQRALATNNDAGTAIAVMTSIFNLTTADYTPSEEVQFDRLFIAPLDTTKWLENSFYPIMRDGSGTLEVQLVMQKVLFGIFCHAKDHTLQQSAKSIAQSALQRAQETLAFDDDKAELATLHEGLFAKSE
ncbi:hypothetical protein B0181_06875 [Moraxella caviae]|nr:DUF2254 family protein [Moraxella caviae]OOR89475.1 hypothetical protein B0181_06875 [Moraxella caviae]